VSLLEIARLRRWPAFWGVSSPEKSKDGDRWWSGLLVPKRTLRLAMMGVEGALSRFETYTPIRLCPYEAESEATPTYDGMVLVVLRFFLLSR